MSTFTVPVVKINAIEPIEGADAIELAVVGDYRSVVRKGQYRAGDLAVYIPEQAVLPLDLLQALGLEGKLSGSEHNRVKAVKLRGCLSQGLLYPVDSGDGIPFISLPTDDGIGTLYVVQPGDDLAEVLGITKYEPVIPTHMSGEHYYAGQNLTVAYDIENFKKYPHVLKEGEEVIYTEKLHGTFCGVGILPPADHDPKHIRNRIVVFSKGLGADGLCFRDVETNKDNSYLQALKNNGIFDKLEMWAGNPRLNLNVPMFLLGEVYGPGIQKGFGYGETLKFRVFDIVSGYRGDQTYANVDTKWDIARILEIKTVPVLYRGPFSKESMYAHTEGLETVSGKETHIREGIVVTPVVERRDPEIGRVILKSVSAAYLTRKGKTTEYQ